MAAITRFNFDFNISNDCSVMDGSYICIRDVWCCKIAAVMYQ